MKASATTSMQLGQQLHMTPQLLQSIRLLQLDGLQLELEIRRTLEHNPLLELDEEPVASAMPEPADAQAEVASFDELPEASLWDVRGASWNDADDDGMQRIAAGESSDPQLRILQRLSHELDAHDLAVAAYWLENCDDAGYLTAPLDALIRRACALFDRRAGEIEAVRQRLLAGDPAGVAACDLRECLLAQLDALPGRVAARPLAARLIRDALDALAAHDIGELACNRADVASSPARRPTPTRRCAWCCRWIPSRAKPAHRTSTRPWCPTWWCGRPMPAGGWR